MGREAAPEHRLMAHYDLDDFWSGRASTHALSRIGRQAIACSPRASHLSRRSPRLHHRILCSFGRQRFAEGPQASNGDPHRSSSSACALEHDALRADPRRPRCDLDDAGERGARAAMAARLVGGNPPVPRCRRVSRSSTGRCSTLRPSAASTLARVLAHLGLPADANCAALRRAREPRPHGEPRRDAPARRRPPPRALAHLRERTCPADRQADRPASEAS